MVWMVNQQVTRGRRCRICGIALLCWLFFMMVTPKIPLSYRHHLFADMRNFLGIPFQFKLLFFSLLCYIISSRAYAVTFCMWVFFGLSIGVPNTLNVITNFPFLIVGVLGFVLSLGGGSFFNIRSIFLFLLISLMSSS